MHDAVVRTFGRPRSFPNVNAADAYVRRAITSTFVDRARSRRRWLAALPRLVAGAAVPDDDVAGRLDARAALRTLPQRQRACVVLRFYDDLTVAEIAAQLGLSEGAVKRYLSDGIHHLNAVLGTEADVGRGAGCRRGRDRKEAAMSDELSALVRATAHEETAAAEREFPYTAATLGRFVRDVRRRRAAGGAMLAVAGVARDRGRRVRRRQPVAGRAAAGRSRSGTRRPSVTPDAGPDRTPTATARHPHPDPDADAEPDAVGDDAAARRPRRPRPAARRARPGPPGALSGLDSPTPVAGRARSSSSGTPTPAPPGTASTARTRPRVRTGLPRPSTSPLAR